MASRRRVAKKKEFTRGERNCAWIEEFCQIPEGKHVGQPIELGWLRDEVLKIYDNPYGTRTAIISVGRKNAKTTFAACLLLLHLCGPEAKLNSQLNSAAQSKDQAAVVFKLAAKMVRLNVTLRANVVVRDTVKELFCPELGTLYKALSAEVKTSFGLGPVFIIHDELGQVRGPKSDLYDALETATGTADEPLSVIISTQAPTDADLLSILIDDAVAGQDKRVTLSLHTAPLDADPFKEETIALANPAFYQFMNRKEVMSMAQQAKRMPSREADFRNLVLNQRVEASSPFVSREVWRSNGFEVITNFKDMDIYAGLDLSEVSDLTAFVPIGLKEGRWHVKPTFWLPEHGLKDRSKQDRVPYDVWKGQGHLETTPGKSIEYSFVAGFLWRFFTANPGRVKKIAFDRWNFKHLKPWLLKAGFTPEQVGDGEDKTKAIFVEFGQGYQSMSPALRELESLLLNGQVAHGNHPVLTMCAANAVVQKDPAGNRKLAKDKSRGRIDGMVGLAMAVGVAVTASAPTAEKEYQIFVV